MSSDRSPRVKGYEVFFGFREPPFSIAPDTRFLFDGASHAAAREQVAHALERREPLVVVTGEIGTGKTLLCRSVVEKLERRTFLSIIHDPMLERDELLKQMLQDFGVISKDRTRLAPTTRHELVHALQEFLLALVPLHAHAVLVIDEAQHLQPDVMEQLRLVSNVHDAAGTLLQIVLVGQPSLDAVLSRPELRQLKQRVSRHVRLEPLGIAELSQYIDHRLAVARNGAASSHGAVTFAPEALSAIWRLSGGTPRVINLLCDRALEAAYEKQAHSVGGPLVDAAAAELGLSTVPPAVAARSGAMPTVAPPAVAAPTVAAPAAAPSVREAGDPWAPGPLEEMPVTFGGAAGAETPAPPRSRLLLVAAVVVVAAGAAWFGVRALSPSGQSASTPPAEQAVPAAPPTDRPAPGAPPPAAAPPSNAPAPSPATSAAAPVPSPATSPAPSSTEPGAPPPSGPPAAFEIVVASFRTMTRASQVAAELEALGQPVRQRNSDGWQQVLAGPFKTREAAEQAQAKLDQAGYTGTQIVPAAPPVPSAR
jgi:type II secretory pathway predicted ATPase ExeA